MTQLELCGAKNGTAAFFKMTQVCLIVSGSYVFCLGTQGGGQLWWNDLV